MSDRGRRPLTHAQRLARALRRRTPPDVDLLWLRGLVGWHAAPAGLASESDARLLRGLAADVWSTTLFGAKYARQAMRRWR